MGEHVKLYQSAKKKKLSGQRLLLVVLRNKVTKKEFAVVTGHFKAGGKKINMQKYHILELVKLLGNRPTIFACDLNNDAKSVVFQFFKSHTTQSLDEKPKERFESVYDLEEKERFSCVKMRKGGNQSDKVGKVKNHTIDYIFYSKDGFKPKAHLEIPKKDEVLAATNGLGLPCWKYPSDHFMLAADLELQ